ncbi:MAG: DUF11 domain-containing protein, partial [Gammaproteobacteria bacterium]|nr:DUF11 domain-containing protein [Gammaproteobacteria bacterium]
MTPPNTSIQNTATATYRTHGVMAPIVQSAVVVVTRGPRTPSTLEFLRYAPAGPGAVAVPIAPTDVSLTGNVNGPFSAVPPPTLTDGTILGVPNALALVTASVFTTGDPLFLRLSDLDQNTNPGAIETVVVTVGVGTDSEVIRLVETGPNTGVFAGYLQTATASGVYDGRLTVNVDSNISATYKDPIDGSDTSTSAALVDPFGVVFDTNTGTPIDGATVSLVNAATGNPAAVFGDNGEPYPSTVISGATVVTTGVGGRTYTPAPGNYRFPFVASGQYRLEVRAPSGYFDRPSVVNFSTLQLLPNAPFALGPGSLEQNFLVPIGPAIKIDLPLDPIPTASALFISKLASKKQIGVGESLRYQIRLENQATGPISGVNVIDTLPPGARYQSGSATRDGAPMPDPTVSADGRTLSFALGTLALSEVANLSYVVSVGVHRAGRPPNPGWLTNRAYATSAAGLKSNVATAKVRLRDDLLREKSYLLGRVIVESCDDNPSNDVHGLAGVRLYLEDGTNVLTDAAGRWHIEGINPGVHVVQVDLSTLPAGYEVMPCNDDSRNAGTAFSRFVDVRGGTVWRTDFRVRRTSTPTKAVTANAIEQSLRAAVTDNRIQYTYEVKFPAQSIENPVATIMLPDGVTYIEGRNIPNSPEISGQAITFRFPDGHAPGPYHWSFDAALTPSASKDFEALRTKSLIQFSRAGGKRERTSVLEAPMNRATTAKHALGPDAPKSTVPAKPSTSIDDFDLAWLNASKPGNSWLWPDTRYNPPIPSIKIAINH